MTTVQFVCLVVLGLVNLMVMGLVYGLLFRLLEEPRVRSTSSEASDDPSIGEEMRRTRNLWREAQQRAQETSQTIDPSIFASGSVGAISSSSSIVMSSSMGAQWTVINTNPAPAPYQMLAPVVAEKSPEPEEPAPTRYELMGRDPLV